MRGQPTSAESLQQSEQGGKLNGKRFEVALAFQTYGPGTSAEVLKAAGLDANRNLMRARVTELADLGMLKQGEPRKCFVTKRRAIVWSYEKCEPRAEPACKATKAELVKLVRNLAALAESAAEVIEGEGFDDDGECEDVHAAVKRARIAIGDVKASKPPTKRIAKGRTPADDLVIPDDEEDEDDAS